MQQFVSCRDDISEITDALGFLLKQSDILITSGGLGPTTDDLTREALATYTGRKLVPDQSAREHLENIFSKKNRVLDPTNYKQASFPSGSTPLENPIGTAYGFLTTTEDTPSKYIFSLPGVPVELKKLLAEKVLPNLELTFGKLDAPEEKALRLFGLGESSIGGVIQKLPVNKNVNIAYRASFPVVEVLLQSMSKDVSLDEYATEITKAIGEEFVFSSARATLDEVVHRKLLECKSTISLAESCTGGRVSSYLTKYEGSSTYFSAAAISYSNESKVSMIGVSSESLEKYGAVSAEVAAEMATQTRKTLGTDIAVSITGIAGPGGGSAEKPVGTFFLGLDSKSGVNTQHYFFDGTRGAVQKYAAHIALDSIRRNLSGLPLLAQTGL